MIMYVYKVRYLLASSSFAISSSSVGLVVMTEEGLKAICLKINQTKQVGYSELVGYYIDPFPPYSNLAADDI